MENAFKSFICYRKKPKEAFKNPDNLTYAWSENVAGLLNHLLINTPELSSTLPALFQETAPPSDEIIYQACPEGIAKNVLGCSYFFVALCPGFFHSVLEAYHKELANHVQNVEEATEAVLNRVDAKGDSSLHIPIACFELLYAMTDPQVQIIPIHISYNSSPSLHRASAEPSGSGYSLHITPDEISMLAALFEKLCELKGRTPDDIKDNLRDFFSSKIRALYFVTNTIEINYAIIEGGLKDVVWSASTESTYRSILADLTKQPSIQHFKASLINTTSPFVPDQLIAEWTAGNDFCTHLSACANITAQFCVPPRNVGRGKTRKPYTALDDNIVYDPLYASQDYPYPRLPYSLIRNFRGPFPQSITKDCRNYRESLGLPSSDFAYWPVDFIKADDKNDEHIPDAISVCAVCFGTLICYHRATKDDICGAYKTDYRSCVADGINMLIALRNPNGADWPAQWKIANGITDMEGTINQTTLSLSTLLSCGFLSPAPNKEEMRNNLFLGTGHIQHLKQRHRFIRESIDYLLEGRGTNDTLGWSYTCDTDDADFVLPTVFVFNVLSKYYDCLRTLYDYATSCDADPEQLENLHPDCLIEELDEIESCLDDTVWYFFDRMQLSDGAFFPQANSDKSITHTAYVIKCLCDYLKKPCALKAKDKILEIVDSASAYLLKELSNRSRNGRHHDQWNRQITIKDHERFEEFYISRTPRKTEKYEHCAELIVAEALIKLIKLPDRDHEQEIQLLKWLAATYIRSVNCPNLNKIHVHSERVELQFPIYYVYYYRMFISDFIKLLQDNPQILESEDTP